MIVNFQNYGDIVAELKEFFPDLPFPETNYTLSDMLALWEFVNKKAVDERQETLF